jgi:Amt family ammonium transporter
MGGLLIGLVAGVGCFYATQLMKRTVKIDDSLDVFPVHGVGGILGTTLTGVFAATALGGIGYAENQSMGGQVLVQLAGIAATVAWSGVLTWALLKLCDALAGMRVQAEQETEGLDTVLHNEKGYNL